MMMKTSFAFYCVTLLALAGTAVFAADEIPKQFKFARYEPMMKRSPFAVATAASAVATTPDFARDLFIANAAHSANGDLVTLASTTDNNFKKYLSSAEPVDGYSISNIEWSERVGETKVTITKDGQFATLTFNQALLSQPLPRLTPVNVPAANAVNPAARMNRLQPAPIPMLPTPPPHVRGVIPRNPGSYSNPAPRRNDGRPPGNQQ